MSCFSYFNNLGFISPYYLWQNGKITTENNFAKIVTQKDNKSIDVAAVIEIISRYHCFADRTLVQGVFRSPWMAKPNERNDTWIYSSLPDHQNLILPVEEIARNLFEKLQTEIIDYCLGKKTIGILLSGGMDSRIVASILNFLTKNKILHLGVVAITWGMNQSRDVIYANEIAKRFKWDWIHIPINPETLYENIFETAKQGCEYSPVHLHGMAKISRINGLDGILAGSYGDSVGRAEYSGKHISQLRSFDKFTFNWFSLVLANAYQEIKANIKTDVENYRKLFPRAQIYQQNEIDQQAHYMRRKLNQCMGLINKNIPVYQVFTHPEVFGYMWSLSPRVRNDQVYQQLLQLCSTDLLDIPWARTGIPFLEKDQKSDGYSKSHHHYGRWIRNELYSDIKKKILSGNIESLGIFNIKAINYILNSCAKFSKNDNMTKLDEIIIWLAAFNDFIQLYEIKGGGYKHTIIDKVSAGFVTPIEFIGFKISKRN